MDVNTISNVTSTTAAYSNTKEVVKAKSETTTNADTGVVYEKSSKTTSNANYKVNKMSEEERAALVDSLKAEQHARQQQLVDIVQKMFNEQATAAGKAGSIWEFLASGEYEVDEATKLQAQEDIAEDGYYGIKQTSERLFTFASALAGDDVDKMKEMQAAMEKGFKQATKAWGKELPDICKDTLEAANKLFDDYYASKEGGNE